MFILRLCLVCLIALGIPTLATAQKSVKDLQEIKAIKFKDRAITKAFMGVPSLVTVSRKGVIRPAGKHRILYSKKIKRFIIGTPEKGLELKEVFSIVGSGPGRLGPGAELRCYQCGCTPVTKAGPNGAEKQCDGACPCLAWIVVVPGKSPIEYLRPDGGWSDWEGLP